MQTRTLAWIAGAAVILAVFAWLVYGPTMANLGHHAVRSGVIP